jgi:membrane protein
VTFLLGAAPKELVEPLVPEIRYILTTPRRGLAGLAALLTIWSAMAGVDSIRVGLNRAYDLREHRSLWHLYALDIIFVIGAAAVLLAFSLLIVVAPIALTLVASYAPTVQQSLGTFDLLRYPIAIILLTSALLLCHRALPARRMALRDIVPGVLLTVFVWLLLSVAFSLYLGSFNTFALTYASLSGIFAAMFFLYLSALVLILGGELNRVITVHREARANTLNDQPPE